MGQDQSKCTDDNMGDERPASSVPSSNVIAPPAAVTPAKSPRQSGVTPGMFITQQEGVFSERYQGLKVLGKGSFGEVILCRDKTTSNECAVKVISKRSLKRGASAESLLREVQLLKELDHPNIMKLYEFFADSGYYYLVGEVYTGGELFDEIISRKRFSEADAGRIVRQVLSGIAYMHKNKIVHRDLKPENLLLQSKDPTALVKIIDFGLSTHFEPQGTKKMKDKIGTAYYIAPEVLHGTYDEKCDVWSIGVILYILLSGCPPFYGSTEFEILKRVETGKFSFNLPQWRKVSEPAKDLIRRMLTYAPKTRISALEALEHEWLQEMTSEKLTDLPALEATMDNMRQFQSSQRLAQAAMLYMGSKLTTVEETQQLTGIFRKLDKNGDGQLDRDELKEGYKLLMKMKGVDVSKLDEEAVEAEIEQVLQSVDFDQNGYLEYSEFVTVAMDRKVLMSRDRLRRAFNVFDTDGSGKISSDELLKLFEAYDIGRTECENIIREIDTDGDGEVDFEEFALMLKKLTMNTDP
eukprot:GHVO01004200.1.p1 GENE.GHVO01004200.1~~GHVO01004200.1.p1  ORF type:complete len:523 (+),score=99.29 GHVO01004200.1:36-1604(+)